jgi:hypothetical protein
MEEVLAGATAAGPALRIKAAQRAALILMDQGAPDRAKALLDIVLKVPPQFQTERLVLRSDWLVSITFAPIPHCRQGALQSLARNLALDDPVYGTR